MISDSDIFPHNGESTLEEKIPELLVYILPPPRQVQESYLYCFSKYIIYISLCKHECSPSCGLLFQALRRNETIDRQGRQRNICSLGQNLLYTIWFSEYWIHSLSFVTWIKGLKSIKCFAKNCLGVQYLTRCAWNVDAWLHLKSRVQYNKKGFNFKLCWKLFRKHKLRMSRASLLAGLVVFLLSSQAPTHCGADFGWCLPGQDDPGVPPPDPKDAACKVEGFLVKISIPGITYWDICTVLHIVQYIKHKKGSYSYMCNYQQPDLTNTVNLNFGT